MCPVCQDKGHRAVATISDPFWAVDPRDGKRKLDVTFVIPIVTPCVCTIRRASGR